MASRLLRSNPELAQTSAGMLSIPALFLFYFEPHSSNALTAKPKSLAEDTLRQGSYRKLQLDLKRTIRRASMKTLVVFAVACAAFISVAISEQMDPRGHGGGDHGGPGWGQNPGVFVDVPWSAINNGDNSGIPPRSPYETHCRDVRHSCFDQWGVQEPGYGQCMASRGC
jgi:hypothetical protein